MADEILDIDENSKNVAGAVTDDASEEIRMLRIDDATKGLKVTIVGGGGSGTVTSIAGGTGILLTPDPIIATGTVALATSLQPIATLTGNSLKYLRVNVGETAVEWATVAAGGITIGTTTITSGTTTRILYDNAGVVGEYTISGSGTIVAMATAPTFGTSITGSYLTASEILITDGTKNIVSAAVATYPSLTELTYLKGVTSAIQTQIGTKAPSTSPTFATSITGSYLTASEILITDGSKNIVSAAVATYPSLTELTYVKGVTSAIQTQFTAKAPLASPTFTGTVTIPAAILNGQVNLDGTPATDGTAVGNVTNTFASGYSSSVGDLVFFGSGGKWLEVDSDAVATCNGLIGIALEAKSDTQAMLVALPGSFVRLDSWNWTVGATLYAGETLGSMQETIPTGADAIIKVVGFAVSADVIYFNPSPDQQSVVA